MKIRMFQPNFVDRAYTSSLFAPYFSSACQGVVPVSRDEDWCFLLVTASCRGVT